jgi:tetratricopeptide (TPR) repeat protein
VFTNLRANGYDVFMDEERIPLGKLDPIILNQIEARAHFLLVLSPGSAERFVGKGDWVGKRDWMRREIEYAMSKRRNIVLLLVGGFTFAGTEKYLIGKLAELSHYSSLQVQHDHFEAAMDDLRARLTQPVAGKVKPAPATDQPEVQRITAALAALPVPTVQQLHAEDYFNRAYQKHAAGNGDGAIAEYSEAIRLDPQRANVYHNRGIARRFRDPDGATADYDEAIRIDPQFVITYINRGILREHKGDLQGAIADYQQYLALGGGAQYRDQKYVEKLIQRLQKRVK